MSTVKKAKKKKLDKQSLTEFRAWLSGVEEMQEPGWIPNETQWELIRQRIDLIDESPTPTHQTAHNYQHRADNHTMVEPLLPAVPSQFDNVQVIAPTTSGLSDIPLGPTVPGPRPKQKQRTLVGSEKTPDIDSTGGYSSSFV